MRGQVFSVQAEVSPEEFISASVAVVPNPSAVSGQCPTRACAAARPNLVMPVKHGAEGRVDGLTRAFSNVVSQAIVLELGPSPGGAAPHQGPWSFSLVESRREAGVAAGLGPDCFC
ncbi:MAG: hypothetical protein MZW92_63620 [Comamonadaceae bacterium]|nr:hypothetical protein [Comamonadaceae bacterium]